MSHPEMTWGLRSIISKQIYPKGNTYGGDVLNIFWVQLYAVMFIHGDTS